MRYVLSDIRPKKAQQIIASNLTYFTYFLIHRQYGKTRIIENACSSYLMQQKIKSPMVGIFCAQFDQAKRLYLKYFQDSFKQLGGTFSSQDGCYEFPRHIVDRPVDTARVFLGGANDRSKGARGLTLHFIACDEFGDWNPGFLESVVLPMGNVHNAYAMITGTPRGPNHFKYKFNHAKKKMESGDKDYFALKWTIKDSIRSGEVSQEQADRWQKESTEESWAAEYMLDFNAGAAGRVFSSSIVDARDNSRIGNFPLTSTPVDLFWDIGVNGTAVWFRQEEGGYNFYRYYMQGLKGVNFVAFVRERVMPFLFQHNLSVRYSVFPHDIKNKEWLSAKSRLDVAREILPGELRTLPAFRKMGEAVDFVLRNFDRCYFDEEGCQLGIDCLEMASFKDGKFDKSPEMVEYTHGTDAFILAENFNPYGERIALPNDFDYFGNKRRGYFKKPSLPPWGA